MVPGVCPQCGGPNPADATRCQWCSAALPPSPPRTIGDSGYRPLPETELPRTTRVSVPKIAAIVIVVAVAIFFFAIVAEIPTTPLGPIAPNVVVSQVVANSPDNACGLNGQGEPGFGANSNTLVTVRFVVIVQQGGPCTVYHVSTSTPGFNVTANLPFTSSGEFSLLEVYVQTPNNYTGPLSITFG
jgi:hypothetical protein